MSTETAITVHPIYGVLAEFTTPEELLRAASEAYRQGYRKLDAYTPYPVEGLAETIGVKTNAVALVTLIGGICGCIGGFSLLYWICVIAYPHNVGGRPLDSWPAFIPITFECLILIAALSAVVSMFAFNGLPQPYHPVFNSRRFDRASRDRFFLCIESADPLFDEDKTTEFLRQNGGSEVSLVPQ